MARGRAVVVWSPPEPPTEPSGLLLGRFGPLAGSFWALATFFLVCSALIFSFVSPTMGSFCALMVVSPALGAGPPRDGSSSLANFFLNLSQPRDPCKHES